MSDTLKIYYEALERLKKKQPNIVPSGTKISKDAVALEAGRQRGSVKKSRPLFLPLIEAIECSILEQTDLPRKPTSRLPKTEVPDISYRDLYEQALGREIALVYEVFKLKKELSQLTGKNVLPIRKKTDT